MTVTTEAQESGIQVIRVSGRLDQEQTVELEQMLMALLDQGHSRLIVDLGQTSYINSGGLRCLVSIWRRAKNSGGDLYLCSMVPRVQQVFSIVGFDKVFEIFTDCAAAKQRLSSG
jgi:anti-sigma B factor antagonist